MPLSVSKNKKMEDILDNIPINRKKKLFTWISLICSLSLIALFAYFMISFPGTIKASETLKQPSEIFIRISQLVTATSIITIILSYVKKEPSSWQQKIATILNLLIFTFIVVVNFVLK